MTCLRDTQESQGLARTMLMISSHCGKCLNKSVSDIILTHSFEVLVHHSGKDRVVWSSPPPSDQEAERDQACANRIPSLSPIEGSKPMAECHGYKCISVLWDTPHRHSYSALH